MLQEQGNGSFLRSLILSIKIIAVFFLSVEGASAQHKGISFQAIIKKPDNTYANVSGITITTQILDPVSNCILREEEHTGKNITNGYLNLVLGDSGVATPATRNPSPILSITQVMDNKSVRTGLKCVDSANTITASGHTYTPSSEDRRVLRVRMNIQGEDVVADFNIRAVGYAINSEMLNSKTEADFANINNAKGVTQSNIESVFERFTKLDGLLNNSNASGTNLGVNITGNAATATSVSGVVPLVNGGTGASSASGARTNLGLGPLATMTPTGTADNTTYLRGDGAWVTVSGGGGGGTLTGLTAGAGLTGGGTTGGVTVGLAAIASNTLLANTTGAIAAPVASSISSVLDTITNANVHGSVLYRSSTGWTVLGAGTDGQFLQTKGANADLQWGSMTMADLRSSVTGTTQLGTSCLAHQTLTYNSVGDVMQCANIAISSSQVSGLGSLATKSSVDLSSEVSGTLPIARIPVGTSGITVAAGNDARIVNAIQNAGTTPSIAAGLEGAVPTAGTVGRIYIATDSKKILRDDGSTWVNIGAVSASDISTGTVPYARLPAGTTANTVAAGDDSRIVNALQKDGSVTATGALDMGNNKILNVSSPTAAADAVNKAYVDAAGTGGGGGGKYQISCSNWGSSGGMAEYCVRINTETGATECSRANLQYGTAWSACSSSPFGGGGIAANEDTPNGYFVMTYNTYTGNLGGLAGANATCLNELTSYPWKGRLEAQEKGLLVSSKVKAFLCDSTTCQIGQPFTRYQFAAVGYTQFGGSGLSTDNTGLMVYDTNQWSQNTFFGNSNSYWTGRYTTIPVSGSGQSCSQPYAQSWTGNASNFAANANHKCTDWSTTAGTGGTGAANVLGPGRWGFGEAHYYYDTDYGTCSFNMGDRKYACSSAYRLLCFVHP